MLGRYEVLRPLARGGMAEVLLARAIGLKGFARHVVIKRIRVENGSDQKAIDMFLDEARLSGSLHHGNIVQVHDVGEEDGKYFFVMEYVHGRDARELLRTVKDKKAQIPLEHVITIVTGAAAGLHHAHEQRGPDRKPLGIVHRDVSPGNILLAFDGSVKVVDFGIAKAHVRSADTQAGETKGKVGYMSPEQCKAQPIDRRTDVFLLGVVLYELATVRRLFRFDSRFETMTAIVDRDIAPPSKFRKDLPAELEQIILKALAKSPDDRYGTADELRLALQAFAARAGLTLSAGRLSDYLKELYGEVPEPWLVDEPSAEPSAEPSDEPGAEPAAPHSAAAPAAEPAPEPPTSEPVPEPPPSQAVAQPPPSAPAPEPPPRPSQPLPSAPAPEPPPRPSQPLRASGPIPAAWPIDPSSARRRKALLLGLGILAAGGLAFVAAAFWGTSETPIDPPPAALAPATIDAPIPPPRAEQAIAPADAGEPPTPAAALDGGVDDPRAPTADAGPADLAQPTGSGSATLVREAGTPAPARPTLVREAGTPAPARPTRPRRRVRKPAAKQPAARPADASPANAGSGAAASPTEPVENTPEAEPGPDSLRPPPIDDKPPALPSEATSTTPD